MDWIKQNRFLATYLGVLIAGVIVFGAFFFLSFKGYKSVKATYDETNQKVKALESKKIFPSQTNLSKRTEQVAAYSAAVDALQDKISKLQVPLNAGMTEREFRERMNSEADAVASMAGEKGITLPEEFGLGLESYLTGTAISPRAVPLLDWEMSAIKRFVEHAANAGVLSIDEFDRERFPQEDKDWDPEAAAKAAEEAERASSRTRRSSRSSRRGRDEPPPAPVDKDPMATGKEVMQTFRFSAKITSSYEALQQLINDLAADDEYYLWLRHMRIENVQKYSPLRSDIPDPVPVAGIEPDEDGNVPMIDASILFGNEKMRAHLHIDAVRFVDSSAEGGGDGTDDATPPTSDDGAGDDDATPTP